ncbi:MAG: hypothetical protein SOZ34_01775 [Clostridia bacterium]|nr:hypothetical protein [Clostridia bacterium]
MSKKTNSILLLFAILLSIVPTSLAQEQEYAARSSAYKEFFVSGSGDDSNSGDAAHPFKTIKAAQNAVRSVNSGMTGDIIVNIAEGTYYLDEMLDFETSDSGFNGYKIIYRGMGDEKPILSGGKIVTGFSKTAYEGIYAAPLDNKSVMQMTVNGKRRYLAKSASLVKGVLDSTGITYDYNDPATDTLYDGFYLSKRDFGIYDNLQDVIFGWNRGYCANYINVKSVTEDPDNTDNLIVTLNSPDWERYLDAVRNPSDPNWPNATYPKPEREFTIMNAFELLDEPGEFYYNKSEKKLYYMPYEYEDMNTAEVVVPVLDTLVCIDGNDIYDKVSDIIFENLQFCDTKWDFSNGFSESQSYNTSGNGLAPVMSRTVLVQRADSIEFTDNIFCNTGGTAIDFYNGVTNSVISGNVFYDIGGTAISTGAFNHGDFSLGSYKKSGDDINGNLSKDGVSDDVPEAYANRPIELVGDSTTKTLTSLYKNHSALYYPGYASPDDRDTAQYNKIHAAWADFNNYSGVWRDDESTKNGDIPFVCFEFLRPYTISAVSVAFTSDITAEERSNFEIIASNDSNFSQFDTLAYEEKGKNGVNTYSVNSSKKYKYIKIQKRTPSAFALSRVWIETTDRKPYVKNQRCKNILIENNLIERTGTSTNHGLGIIITHAEDSKILHNEIKHTGYTGISVGFSWHKYRPTCYNMEVAYNYIYDVCRLTYDGGGIYMLGPQYGSEYHHNHIEQTNQSVHSFYTDNGSCGQRISNNYIEGASHYVLSPYVGADSSDNISNVVFDNNYATRTRSNDSGKAYNTWEEPILEIIGQPSIDAYNTYKNAGLEEQYKYIKTLLPEYSGNTYESYAYNKAVLADEYSNLERNKIALNNLKSELKYTLNNAKFGDGLGMYPTTYKTKISKLIGYIEETADTDMYMCYTKGKLFEEELKTSLNRYSLEETLSLCEEAVNEASENIYSEEEPGKENTYPENAVLEAQSKLSELKQTAVNTPEDEYQVLVAAEEIYNTLKSSVIDAKILGVNVFGADGVNIDNDAQSVTVYLPARKSLTVNNVNVNVNDTAMLWAITGGEQDLEKGLTVPIRCLINGKFKIWKINGEYTPVTKKTNLSADDFTKGASDSETVKFASDGVVLTASAYAYMASAHGDSDKTTVKFNPITNNSGTFTIICGANSNKGFEYASKRADYDRIEAEFSNSTVKIYKVTSGERTAVTAVSGTGLLWNQKNTLSYKLTDEGNDTRLTIELNGKTLCSETVSGIYGRYMGFYIPYMNVKVYN